MLLLYSLLVLYKMCYTEVNTFNRRIIKLYYYIRFTCNLVWLVVYTYVRILMQCEPDCALK